MQLHVTAIASSLIGFFPAHAEAAGETRVTRSAGLSATTGIPLPAMLGMANDCAIFDRP